MSWALVWALGAIGLVIAEMFTMEFTFLSLALGALGAAGVAALGFGLGAQLGVAVALGAASVFMLKPFLRSRLAPRDTATATDLIVGSEAEVIEAIRPPQVGKVKLDGVIWNAESDREVPVGAQVVVTELDGAKLRVMARGELLPRRASAPLPDTVKQAEALKEETP